MAAWLQRAVGGLLLTALTAVPVVTAACALACTPASAAPAAPSHEAGAAEGRSCHERELPAHRLVGPAVHSHCGSHEAASAVLVLPPSRLEAIAPLVSGAVLTPSVSIGPDREVRSASKPPQPSVAPTPASRLAVLRI